MAKKQTARKSKRHRAPIATDAHIKSRIRQRAEAKSLALTIRDPHGMVPQSQPPLSMSRQIGAGLSLLGELGLVEAKFTKAEIAVMNRAVDDSKVRTKPTKKGPPIPFLPHYEYTKWFNEAWGHGAWALVPADLPKMTKGTVSREYVLFVHGRPVAFGVGEQDYFENNPQQTYGDVLEATHSSAMRRCAKHLGMGLELWDKDWCTAYLKKYNLLNVRAGDGEGQRQPPPQSRGGERPPAASRHAHQDAPITEPQYGRLLGFIKKAGRTKSEVLAYLGWRYGIKDWAGVKAIKRSDYDAICSAVEKSGALPDKDTQVREADEILDADRISWGDDDARE